MIFTMKVLRKQNNSKMCLVCGVNNSSGLKAPFYEMEDHTVVSLFQFSENHQSYPERTHGGMVSSMLDEIIGRAIWIDEPVTWGVTMELNVKYRKPVPYNKPLKAIGRIIKNTNRGFIGTGEIYDMEGNLLAEGKAMYFKMPLNRISSNIHESVNIYVSDGVKDI